MTRYKKYMQTIHNLGRAYDIETAARFLISDIQELLVKTGVKQGSPILKKIEELSLYNYDHTIKQNK